MVVVIFNASFSKDFALGKALGVTVLLDSQKARFVMFLGSLMSKG